MRVGFEAFWLHKAGGSPDEYEDAFAPAWIEADEYDEFRCAVADGATETSFSGVWARLLVEAFADGRLRRIDGASLDDLAAHWHAEIAEKTRAKPLPWYAEEKLRQGAFSSLLGLILHADGRWHAVCFGDSTLIHIRTNRFFRSFPYKSPDQFTSRPALLSTQPSSNGAIPPRWSWGRWREGDHFLLMTDALAHYYLSSARFRHKLFAHSPDQPTFERWIEAARAAKTCRNDDVTLLKVHVQGGERGGGLP
jgi:hypothetical protein